MTPPRTPHDEELERYVRGSRPPPALASARQQVAARLETPTGVHWLDKLHEELQRQAIEAVRDKLAAANERAERAERQIRGFWKVLAAILVAVVSALILRKV